MKISHLPLTTIISSILAITTSAAISRNHPREVTAHTTLSTSTSPSSPASSPSFPPPNTALTASIDRDSALQPSIPHSFSAIAITSFNPSPTSGPGSSPIYGQYQDENGDGNGNPDPNQQKYYLTTFWTCVYNDAISHCGWHEPIIPGGDQIAAAAVEGRDAGMAIWVVVAFAIGVGVGIGGVLVG